MEPSNAPSLLGEYGQVCGGEDVEDRKSLVWTEVRRQFDLAGSMIVANLLQFCIALTSSIFVGHLGELELSSSSVASSIASVTGFTLLIGLSCALETLCGQAFGAKQFHLLGMYAQATALLLLAISVPLSILWLNMETVLKALGQDPEISRMAGVYFTWLCPSLFASAMTQPLLKFLQAQSVVLPMMLCTLVTAVIHVPMCFFLINVVGLGFRGGAVAVSISYYVNLLMLTTYVRCSNEFEETWLGLTKEAFGSLTAVLKLGISSSAMICLEYWAFEILVLIAGLLPNPQLQVSILSICLTTSGLGYTIPVGLGSALCTRVSNELGAGRPEAAKFAVNVGVRISIAVAAVVATTLYLVRNLWGRAFSNEDELVYAVAQIIPFVAGACFLDGVQAVLSGVARGCGWQETGAWVNLVSYYGIGVPAAVYLGYYSQFGALGLWGGFYCGLSVQVLLLIILTTTTNWESMAKKAQERVCAPADASCPLIV